MSPVIMVDGINLDAAVIQARFPRQPVAIPIDGEWAWTAEQEARSARKIRYSVMAGNPRIARAARVKDVEARWRVGGDAGPQDAPPFLDERQAAGHLDGTVYASLLTVPAVLRECSAAGVVIPRWWLAWYWGRPGFPTVGQVLAELKLLTGVELDPKTVWGCQAHNYQQWDFTAVYGIPDFSR